MFSRNFFWLKVFLFCFLNLACEKKPPLNLPELSIAEIVLLSEKGVLQIGLGKNSITPSLADMQQRPYWLAGFDRGRQATKIHDDIWARTIALRVNDKTLVIVTLDLVGIHQPEVEKLRLELKQADLSVDYLVVSATHNHQAPDTLGIWGSWLNTGHTPGYRRFVREKTLVSISEAIANLAPAELSWSQVSTKPLKLIKDFREPQHIPEELTTLSIVDKNKTIQGVIVHWNCHPEALGRSNTQITSDFPHYLRQKMELDLGKPVIYWSGILGGLMGPAPEVITPSQKKLLEGTWEHAQYIGETLADLAIGSMKTRQVIEVPELKVTRSIIDFDMDNILFKIASFLGNLDRPLPTYSSLRSEIALLQIGELSIQTIPGEIYPELVYGPITAPKGADFPHAIREEPVLDKIIPGKYRLILGLAQDEIGYIIPRNGWDQESPYLPDSYGEEVSLGINTARKVHDAVLELSEAAQRK